MRQKIFLFKIQEKWKSDVIRVLILQHFYFPTLFLKKSIKFLY